MRAGRSRGGSPAAIYSPAGRKKGPGRHRDQSKAQRKRRSLSSSPQVQLVKQLLARRKQNNICRHTLERPLILLGDVLEFRKQHFANQAIMTGEVCGSYLFVINLGVTFPYTALYVFAGP